MWEFVPKRIVSIYGEVNKPGHYPYAENMTLRDQIFAAGNHKESAYLKEAEISSYEIRDGKLCKISHRVINLENALAGKPQDNIMLKPYDRVFIKKISNWRRIEYVEITGEVVFPGKYVIKKGERLSSLIKRAGGFTDKAYLRGAVFTRKRVQELQQKQINEMIDRLEKELMVGGAAGASAAITPQEAQIKSEEVKLKRQFLAKLRQTKAKGRLVIHLDTPERLKGTVSDIELEGGDKLYIPSNPQTIQVVGAVYNQTAFIYEKGKGIAHYIKLAGGCTENANKDHIYVLKVDGTAVFSNGRCLGFHLNPFKRCPVRLEPGDTIVVPEKLEKIAWLRNVKDITQILYQIAVTSGVVIGLY
jgi:protein involved in polysaccharide export with SLBB domain